MDEQKLREIIREELTAVITAQQPGKKEEIYLSERHKRKCMLGISRPL